jgi:hypothetical protein
MAGQPDVPITLRTSEGFVENFGPTLIARIGREAPGVRLRFMPKPDKDGASLREGLEKGPIDSSRCRCCGIRGWMPTQAAARNHGFGLTSWPQCKSVAGW